MPKSYVILNNDGFTLAQKGSFKEALLKFNKSISQKKNYYEAWLNKIRTHIMLKEYAEAVVTLERLEQMKLDLTTIKNIEHLYKLIYTTNIKKDQEYQKLSLEQLFRQDICNEHYLLELHQLQCSHQSVTQWDYPQQIKWIEQLIEFCLFYYNNPSYPFIKNDFLEKDSDGFSQAFYVMSNKCSSLLINIKRHGNHTQYLKEMISHYIQDTQNEILSMDAITILHMIFETIHYLPREKRGELVAFLPWGANSWYLLEFCGAIINGKNYGHLVPILYTSDLDVPSTNLLYTFQQVQKDSSCLVKIAIRDIIKCDLPIMLHFFSNISNPSGPSRMGDLPNLRPLLWNHKQIFNLTRLTSILPTDRKPMSIIRDDKQDYISLTPYAQLILLNKPDFSFSLKSRLTLIRRLQLLGEIFTKKHLGDELDKVTYINPKQLTSVRNALCHIEDLVSYSEIYDLEQNASLVNQLYDELSHLNKIIYHEIVKFQSQFPRWSDTHKAYSTWSGPVSIYWNAVKEVYRQNNTFDHENYSPNTNLLPEDQINFILSRLKEGDIKEKICHMLKGVIPFQKTDNKELSLFIIDGIKAATVRKPLQAALKNYNQLKKAAEAAWAKENKEKYCEIERLRNAEMHTHFPRLLELSQNLDAQYRPSQHTSQVEILEIFNCLKSRMSMLRDVLIESGIDFTNVSSISESLIAKMLINDVELLFACAYLTGQIVEIVNKFVSLNIVHEMTPELAPKIDDYIALRNGLEHSNPIYDSEMDLYIHMQSKVNIKLATVVFDLVATHYDVIINHIPQNIPDALIEKGRKQQNSFIDFSQTKYMSPARLSFLRNSADEKSFFNRFSTHRSKEDSQCSVSSMPYNNSTNCSTSSSSSDCSSSSSSFDCSSSSSSSDCSSSSSSSIYSTRPTSSARSPRTAGSSRTASTSRPASSSNFTIFSRSRGSKKVVKVKSYGCSSSSKKEKPFSPFG
ncbi:tetratricopeptide repeat protein [Legionella quateirensis]|uniref:Uncharacterized protein n=1 Tax=Legionella quateirensis TaxID=45072 RepID=A0A378L1J4_9GAMM|nr:tetratricopeptide repeat protein [Legionella quateirensis]KTD50785.1 hypothetical protein Lqua_1012 [Legionella quateirensis]STY17970.1 Uncharacterised protein [Legionella quateirensis]